MTEINHWYKYLNFTVFSKHKNYFILRASIVPNEQYEGEEWNVRDDHLLLDAVEMYGYGNWKDIAKHVESKSEAQVKFRRFFLHGALGY